MLTVGMLVDNNSSLGLNPKPQNISGLIQVHIGGIVYQMHQRTDMSHSEGPCGRLLQVVYQSVSRQKMLGLLREHLRANLIRLNCRWHYQRRGIPQVCLAPLSPAPTG